jgi:predicted esterase
MRITTLVTFFLLFLAGFFFLGAGPANAQEEEETCYFWEDGMKTRIEDCSEITYTGHSQGNHDLDCTVIQPWPEGGSPDPRAVLYPIIGWANGWEQGNVIGEYTTFGYKLGLIEWALDGPYIVVAANQWSVQESDVLACVQLVIQEYGEIADADSIGLAGHSQGGGAVIKAGDGEPNGFDITTVIAMNPYGPGWVNSGNQDGPLMLLGGTDDTTTPTDSFEEVWQAIQSNGQGGLLAVLEGGSHNSEAWGVYANGDTMSWEDAQEVNFGKYQRVTELWWNFYLNGNARSGRQLQRLLNRDPSWVWLYTDGF